MNIYAKTFVILALIAAVTAIMLNKNCSCCNDKACQGKSQNCQSNCQTCPQRPASDDISATSPALTTIAAPDKLPVLLELGADKCVPCKMMVPVMEELRTQYAGEMEVQFFDVWKQPEIGKKYQISGIPTQIFLDPQGNELFRHTGFYSKDDIVAKWQELGFVFKTLQEALQ